MIRITSFRGLSALNVLVCLSVLLAFSSLACAKMHKASGITPHHPRVSINWTEMYEHANITQNEKDALLHSDLVLTKLLVINRHGHRAPNAQYWEMCPNDSANRAAYDVDAEDLTGLGMQEELQFGSFMRQRYRNFIGDRFNRTLHYFRAVGEPRILQSAVAVAQGVFPNGFGPNGYILSRPQFVPIFSDMDTHEYLLDDVPCFRRAERDSAAWVKHNFAKFMGDENVRSAVKKMFKYCGREEDLSDFRFIKTVADGMTFNSDLQLKVCKGKVTKEDLFQIRNVSFHLLMERLYNSDEQQTYTVVDLPRNILTALNHTHIGSGNEINDFLNTRQEMTMYFVHREGLYAFAQFFGFQYNISGLPPGEIPVASSLIIEKLMPAQDQFSHDRRVYVRLTMWAPETGVVSVPVPQCRMPALCELKELIDIYEERLGRTGSWEKLCNYTINELNHTTDIR